MSMHNCQFKADGSLKCWGNNQYGQLGLGDKNDRGDQSNEMGPYLSYVKLGTGLVVDQVSTGFLHTCVHFTSNQIKCWGNNLYGQLGLGISTSYVGDDQSETPDKLGFLNLGTVSNSVQVYGGNNHSCVLFANKQVKCFGYNNTGQIGYEGATQKGTVASDMADNLPFVPLGTGVEIDSFYLSGSGNHNCIIILNSQLVKCWGLNSSGQLGYNDNSHRGKSSNTMGDNLQTLDLGDEDRVKTIGVGDAFTCALRLDNILKCCGINTNGQLGIGSVTSITTMMDSSSIVTYDTGKTIKLIDGANTHNCILFDDNISLKCIGGNFAGQLGLGDSSTRGNFPSNKFPTYPAVNLGTGNLQISFINTYNSGVCVNFVDKSIKCFGASLNGRSGYGHTNVIGTSPSQMGSNLPFLDIFSTFAPTKSPTKKPTVSPTPPTKSPSFNPTIDPTSSPSSDPTSNPTNVPTLKPSISPTLSPTISPTRSPSKKPTKSPSFNPTIDPTSSPSSDPTSNPTNVPTLKPSISPTLSPTISPSKSPTTDPTIAPTYEPSHVPSDAPSNHPSISPSMSPTTSPSLKPTDVPTNIPSSAPSNKPSISPTSISPSTSPITSPSLKPISVSSLSPTSIPIIPPTNLPIANPTNSPTSTAAGATINDSSVAVGLGVSIPLIAVAAAGFFFFKLQNKKTASELEVVVANNA